MDSTVASSPEPESLVRSFLPHVRGIAVRLTRNRPDRLEDAHSAGLVGLTEAVAAYDPGRGRFDHHAHRFVKSRIIDYLRSESRRDVAVPFSAIGAESSGSEPSGPEIDSGAPPVGWELRHEDFVLMAARRLPGRHGEVIRHRYLDADSLSPAGCAARMGLKVARVVQLHREALAMLAASLGGRSLPVVPD